MLSPKQTMAGRESAAAAGGGGAGADTGGGAAARSGGSSLPEHPANSAAIEIHHTRRIVVPYCHNKGLIEVRGLTKSIDTGTHRVDILKGINLLIPRGQFAAIMGPSGSGKSTLLGLLAGLDSPTSGQVLLDGEDITDLAEDEMAQVRGRKIGFVFQSYHLIPTLTAEENVLLPMELAGNGGGGRSRARELLARVGLDGRFDHYPVQLSGGEQQRVAIARALANAPSLLLAAEPTGNLDHHTAEEVFELLSRLVHEMGLGAVIATHNLELAGRMDRTLSIDDGRVVEV